VLSVLTAASAWALPAESAAPQTARQALMEMFSGKQGSFMKHLPAATLAALEKSGALATLQQYSALAGHMQTQKAEGSSFETFETGAVMLAMADAKGQTLQVVVDKDSLQGDEDSIEVSFHTYKDQVVQRTPYLPRMTFVMKTEAGVWRLNEIQFTVRVPLADPDFLKSITDGIKSRSTAAAPLLTRTEGVPGQTSTMQTPMMQTSTMQISPAQPTITFGNDAAVLGAMRSILTAEATYSRAYRSVGFTCTLSDLDGFGGGEVNEHQAMLIPSGLAGGKKYGYVFALSGCSGNPASVFRLTATPAGNNFGRKAFCADQSGGIRYSADGNAATCLASGVLEP
jgi:hypothetical protein